MPVGAIRRAGEVETGRNGEPLYVMPGSDPASRRMLEQRNLKRKISFQLGNIVTDGKVKNSSSRRANSEERVVLVVRRSDEGCSGTQKLDFLRSHQRRT